MIKTILLSALLATTAHAVESTTTVYQQETVAIKKNIFVLDLLPLALKGVGLSYQREITPQWTLGAFVSSFALKTSDEQSMILKSEFQETMYGGRAQYFYTGNAHNGGFYATGSLGLTTAKQSATYFSIQGAPTTVTDFLYRVGTGYQGRLSEISDSIDLTWNIGAMYGHGYEYKTQVSYSNGNPNNDFNLRDGLFFELGLGLLF